MRKYNIASDLIQVKAVQPVVYKQYDNGDNLEVELYDDGEKITLTTETVLAYFQLPDNTVIQKTCSIVDGNAVATLDNNILSLAGTVSVEYTIYTDDSQTTTRTLLINVESSINRNEAVETTPQWDVVNQMLDLKTSDGDAIAEKIETLNQAVYQAAEDKFNELSTAAQVDSEVILARGGQANLKARLDNTDTQLAQIMYNVKSFGAKGDGVTDDSVFVQNAINEASTNKGVVYFPAGTYIINNIELKSGVSLVGAGNNATFIKRNGTDPVFYGIGTLDVNSTPTLFGVTFKDMVILTDGIATTDLMTIQTASNFIFENVSLGGKKCTLLALKGLWDSRFINFHVANGGNTDLSLPAIMIYGETVNHKQTKEINFVNLWMESYEYCGIQTSYTGVKPQLLLFNNVKMESFNCDYRHIDMTVNSMKIKNFYIQSANVSDHPAYFSNCYGIYGDIQIEVNNPALPSINGLIKFINSQDIDLLVIVPTPLPIINNVVSIDNPNEQRINIRIASSVRTFNGNNSKTFVNPFSQNIQRVTSDTYDCSYVWQKDGRLDWRMGRPTLNGSNEEMYIASNAIPFLTFRALNGSVANGSRQIRFGGHAALDSAYNGNALLILGNYTLWVDSSGRLRMKNGTPTSDTDGTIVGTQA